MKSRLFTALGVLLLAPSVSAIIDTNNNGLSDLWERAYNNDELFAETFDPQADEDFDGWTNAQEAAAGTNPFDPNPPDGMVRPETAHIPAVYGEPDENGIPELVTPEAVTVTWPTLVGKQYTLLFSPNLSADSWFAVGAPYIGNGNDFVYGFETNDTDSRFWRVAVTDVDTDGDGLTDSEEGQLGTDPTKRDTDHDGVSDWDELMANSTNPVLALDLDSDGMADDLEKHLAKQFLAVNSAPEFWGTRYQDLQNGNLDASFDYTGDGLAIGAMIPTLTVIPQAGPSESGFLLEAQERHNSLLGYFQIPDPLNYPEGEATGQYHFSIPHEFDGNTDLYSLSDLNPAYLTTRIDSLAYGPYSNPTLVPWIVADSPYWSESWSGFESGPVPGNATRYQGRILQTRIRLVATRADHLDLTQAFLKVTSKRQIDDLGFGEVLTAEPGTITLPKGRFATEWIDFQPTLTAGQETVETMVPVDVGVDNNRDGNLDLSASDDRTAAEKPYRFWLNNDHDNYGNDTYNAEYDHPWTTGSLDNANNLIESERDLEDLARLHLNINGIQSQLEAGTLTLGLKWKSTLAGTPKIRLFKAVEADGGTKYLSDAAQAAAQMADGRDELGVVQGTAVCDLPVSFWTSTSAKATKHLLFEGLGEGKGELTLVVKKGGTVIGESGSVFLDLLDIRKMYERWKVSDAAVIENPDKVAVATVSGVDPVSDPFDHPFQPAWDEDTTDKSYIICVHGWRKSYVAARSDEITIFKRLWHRGFKGRYAGFKWPTLTGGEVAAKYNHSEYRAWKCGAAFKAFVESLPSDYRKNVIAHSLGNVVVSSALSQGLVLNYYALLNGAISAQCFDPDPALKQAAANQTLVIDGYPDIDYMAWAGGDLGDDPLPVLSALSYRNRVGVSVVGTTTLVNFYLTNDLATKDGWEANQWGAGDNYPLIDSKPIDGYCYDIGIRLNYDPIGFGDRALTDPHEAMSMANQSMTKAVGAEGRAAGSIKSSVDLNGPGMGFDKEHEAVFKFRFSRTWTFYHRLMKELGYNPTL